MAAVGQLQLQRGEPVIPHAARGALLGQVVQGVAPVSPGVPGVGREAPVGVLNQSGEIAAPQPGTVIGVQQHAKTVGFHLIRRVFCMQGKETLVAKYHRGSLTISFIIHWPEPEGPYPRQPGKGRRKRANVRSGAPAIPVELRQL